MKTKQTKEKTPLNWDDPEAIPALLRALNNNEIAITSTDTIPGFLASLTEESFKKLCEIKGEKRAGKPFLILIADLDKFDLFVKTNELEERVRSLLAKAWPGPLTCIFNARNTIPLCAVSAENTVALRCPNHEGLIKLLKKVNGLFSTSANYSGKNAPLALNEIDEEILGAIKLLVDDTEGSLQTAPSTILDFTHKGIIRVVRPGAYPIAELEALYGTKFNE